MKRLLHYFICVLIILPSLACAMPCGTSVNHSKAMANEHQAMAARSHSMPSNNTEVNEQMFLIDCVNGELDKPSDTTKLENPVYNSYPVADSALHNLLNEQLQLSELNLLLWPPPWAKEKSFNPPLILTTQRFRI